MTGLEVLIIANAVGTLALSIFMVIFLYNLKYK